MKTRFIGLSFPLLLVALLLAAQTAPNSQRGTRVQLGNVASTAPGIMYFDATGSAHPIVLDPSLSFDPSSFTLKANIPAAPNAAQCPKAQVIEAYQLAAGQSSVTTAQPVNQSCIIDVSMGSPLSPTTATNPNGDYSLSFSGNGIGAIVLSNNINFGPGLVVRLIYTPQ